LRIFQKNRRKKVEYDNRRQNKQINTHTERFQFE
jgi:hypothetical protein